MDEAEEAPPGVPEWVVTYGDMMSLLLTFFIMLVSMSEIVSTQKYRAVLDALHQRLGYRFAPAAPPGENFPLNQVLDRIDFLQLGSFVETDNGYGGTTKVAVEGDDRKVFTGPEGSARRIGTPLRPTDGGRLDESDTLALANVARGLLGEPNKIEVRSWVPLEQLDDASLSHERRSDAYRRAAVVQQELIAAGVDPLRLRCVVLPAPPGSSIVSETLRRRGAVTLAVLDTYGSDFVGPNASEL